MPGRWAQLHLLFGLSIFFARIGDIRRALAVAEQARVIAVAAEHSGFVGAVAEGLRKTRQFEEALFTLLRDLR